jgi:uncharacterized protein (DUF305 family)
MPWRAPLLTLKGSLMKHTTTVLVSSTVVAAALALTGCAASSTTDSGMNGSGMSSSSSMPGMGDSSAGPTASGSFTAQDVTFVQEMLPHHAQAVQMSDMLLSKGSGVNTKVVALATKIKQEQSPEITEMTGWLKGWNKSASGMSGSMTGMMSSSDMTTLDKASAADAGKLYLTQMMQHHTGAIDMAKTELGKGTNPEAVTLARSIVGSQSAEITRMKDLLASL